MESRNILNTLGKQRLYFDGGMGTMLQGRGLGLGELPEIYNITHPDIIRDIHKEYLEAGANIITTNTFGCNKYKLAKTEYTVEQIIKAAIEITRGAIEATGCKDNKYVALDIGPCGKVLKPIGDTEFDEVYEVVKEQAIAGEKAGADLVILETYTDLYELKASILAVKENTNLPIFATMSFEENGRSFFGTSLESMIVTLEGLGVNVLGINCSLGPKQLKPLVTKLAGLVHIPFMLQPNAGLPIMDGDRTYYDITADEFADISAEFASLGASVLGGCCGTNPGYIKKTINKCKDIALVLPDNKRIAKVCSASTVVDFEDIRIIGERINPTGKKKLQAALRAHDMDYVVREAIKEDEQGAHVLDVNMGMPDLDEVELLVEAVQEVQAAVNLPLQIDSSNVEALERAVRIYNGKPLINSVNGKEESLEAILPIAKKYGAAVLGLALDEKGIPETAEERLEIAKKIVKRATDMGIPKEDVFIDCLVVTASAQQSIVKETLKAVKMVTQELGVKTVLGVSNISFGLPQRGIINRNMLMAAMVNGLNAPIMNPGDEGMLQAIAAYRVLMGLDEDCKEYIDKYTGVVIETTMSNSNAIGGSSSDNGEMTINNAILKGLREEAKKETVKLLEKETPLDIIEKYVVPALDEVGVLYETQKLFLPQLLKAAEAAKGAFEIIQDAMTKTGNDDGSAKTKFVIATVFGDIHDIGKNIVKVILENYNFDVYDLGKDVPAEKVIETIKTTGAKIVGLSALMTTTVASMKETIELIRKEGLNVKVIVGGAVLTPELAEYVGADFYAKDAMETVRIASEL